MPLRDRLLQMIEATETECRHYKVAGLGIDAAACQIEISAYRKVLRLIGGSNG